MTQFSFIYHLYSISRHFGNRRWGYACVSVFFFMFFPFLAHQQGLERKWWKFACRSRASEGAAFGPFALEQLEDDMSNCKVLANTTNLQLRCIRLVLWYSNLETRRLPPGRVGGDEMGFLGPDLG